MKDNLPIPNFGSDDPALNRIAGLIEKTFRALISRGSAELTTINLQALTVATLPTRAREGDVSYASDGRKNGEGAGDGTGVLVFFDGSNWIACDSGQTVSA